MPGTEVACPMRECDGVLQLQSTVEKDIAAAEEEQGWAIRAAPTGRVRVEVRCSTCRASIVDADSTPDALSGVLGMIKQGQLATKETSDA